MPGERAGAIKDYLVAKGLRASNLRTYSLGEAKSTADLDQSRRGVVVSGKGVVARALAVISPQDVYLIDSSGSMRESWQDVVDHPFPKEVAVCNFDGDHGLTAGIGSPDGETPLWESAHTALQRMRPGQKLLILSDGANTEPFTHGPDQIIQLAKQKKIPISVIYAGNPDPKITQPLAKIASRTGGSFYLPSE